jgi:hypothetical protein
MKTEKLFLGFLLAALIFYSCRKQFFSIKIIDAENEQPLQGVEVQLWEEDRQGAFHHYTFPSKYIATEHTDSEGKFKFNKPLYNSSTKHSFFKIIYPNYWNMLQYYGDIKNSSVSLIPVSWAKIYIKNISPIDSADKITIDYMFSGYAGEKKYDYTYNNYGAYGSCYQGIGNIDTSIVVATKKNGRSSFEWVVNKDFQYEKMGTVQINCNAQDTSYYSVFY